jgi:uncharacterized protein
MNRRGDWMQTFTGRQYWPLDPRADEVHVEDIAHHLAMICRYAGACERFYSVAEHSVHVSYLVPEPLRLRALLHEAPEAYCHDIIRPIKCNLAEYHAIEYGNWRAILERFAISTTDPDGVIKLADNAMLLAEQAALMKPSPQPRAPIDLPLGLLEAAHDQLRVAGDGWTWQEAEHEFLQRFAELTTR